MYGQQDERDNIKRKCTQLPRAGGNRTKKRVKLWGAEREFK